MNKINFWLSLEQYFWKLVGRNPLPWPWIGVGIIVMMLLSSILNMRNSVIGAKDINETIVLAAKLGDYELAKELYETRGEQVLGTESEMEDKIYPERIVEKKITELEAKLEIYPGNREIYQSLSNLYAQLGKQEAASEYLEMARVLDPNEVSF